MSVGFLDIFEASNVKDMFFVWFVGVLKRGELSVLNHRGGGGSWRAQFACTCCLRHVCTCARYDNAKMFF